MANPIQRLRRSRAGRAWLRFFSHFTETVFQSIATGFLVAFLLVSGLVWFLWFFVTENDKVVRMGIVLDSLSALALIALTFILIRIEARRDRAEFALEDVHVHEPPAPHEPDQFTIAFRLINTGGRQSVVRNSKSYVNAFDQLGSSIRLETYFWPYRVYRAERRHGSAEPASDEAVVQPGTVKDYIAQVRLPKAVDAYGIKLQLSLKPAIGPRVNVSFKAASLQEWLEPVRARHPNPVA